MYIYSILAAAFHVPDEPNQDGRLHENVKATISGMALSPDLVEAGRENERKMMKKIFVYERRRIQDAISRRVKGKWLDDERCDEHGNLSVSTSGDAGCLGFEV